MIIEIRNCNSIDYGEIAVVENSLNIFHAINGTGKSTISRAISAKNDAEIMENLRPFKYERSEDAHNPHVSGIDHIKTVETFDENYVAQYVFKTDELIQNSFEIFIKTPDYEKHLQTIDELIKDTRNTFAENPELDELINDFTVFIDGFGKAQGGYSAAGSLGKGLGKGNKIHNIPIGLAPYKDYIENITDGANAKWLRWHLTGNEFIDVASQCPYCAVDTDDEAKTNILKVAAEFDANAIEHLNKMLTVFEKLKNYFSDSTNQRIAEISKTISGISPEQKAYLLQIKEQVVTLKEKLWKIKTMGFISLKDVDKVVNEISSYKIDLSYLNCLNSDYSQKKVYIINVVLDTVLQKATDLQAAIGKQNTTIKKTIIEYSNEINSFLKYAGYQYIISLEDDGKGSYKLKLKHVDMAETINKVESHLSFGERNAFALVLFMYHTLKSNPDLIILDDPISSFDSNKKYAIIYKLFKEKNHSFKGKTVILLTHEFGTVIDTIYNMPGSINATAKHLENKNGQLIEKAITRDKICSFPMIARENIKSSVYKINKLIYLRRLFEVDNQKDNAWQLLSNLFKDGRETPRLQLNDNTFREMTDEEITKASAAIRQYILEWSDYDREYKQIQDKLAIVSLYKSSNSNYEKLQLYRIINNSNNSNNSNNVIKKFVNETFHIENDYLFQLNPRDFEVVPQFVISACDEDIEQIYPLAFLTGNTRIEENSSSSKTVKGKKQIQLFDMPASAGTGHWIDDSVYSTILVEDIDCDFAANISGDSMAPKIPSKSIVFVKFAPDIKEGEIGIFNLNGNIYCKQLGQDSLISLNNQYEPIEISEYDDLRSQGRIVKIVTPESTSAEVEFL